MRQPDTAGRLITGPPVSAGVDIAMHVISELMTTLACIVAAVAIAWNARCRYRIADEYRGVMGLLLLIAVAFGANQILDLVALWSSSSVNFGLLDMLTAAVTLGATLALWPRLAGLASLPSARDLIEVNRRLSSEEAARSELVGNLTHLNNELEQRVAERTAELEEAKQRFEVALLGSNITMAQQDRGLRYTWVHNPPADLQLEQVVGATPDQFLPPAVDQVLEAAKLRVMATRQPERIEVSVPFPRGERWFDERIEPVIRGGEVVGVISVAIDITTHKRSEQMLFSLLRELTHRSKNLLAVVQGLARQTAETTQSMPEFNRRFASRLQALSGAHELLVRRAWRGVELHDLVRQEIDANLLLAAERVSIRGEREILGPEAAQNIALGLHELMNNALIHGALAAPAGSVDVSWGRIGSGEAEMLELCWSEVGRADEVIGTENGALSRTLVERLVPRAIEGTSDLIILPDGLRWTLRFPVRRLVADA